MRISLSALLVFLATTAVFADDPSVSLTVYNQNLALVRETRELSLRKGVQDFSYDGVAAMIDPTSVRFSADGIAVLEQNFEFDLVDRQTLMEKYLGETIDVVTDAEVVRGRLLSANGGIIIEDDDGNVRIMEASSVQSIRFPDLPEGLVLKPTLRWTLDSKHTGKVESELYYLTGGIGWEASYVAAILGEDKLELSGWVQITNRSGASYVDATLKLMAGDVRVMRDMIRGKGPQMMATEAMAPGFQQKDFYEYHLYTLPRSVTVHDNQTKQIALIEPRTVPAKRTYTFNGAQTGDKVEVGVEFVNDKASGLGMPLPAGKVRMVMKDDADGSLQFVGEDRIDHTPDGETVRLTSGYAFDIVGERTRTDFKRLSNNSREEAWKIELRNRKKASVTVTVQESLGGDWTILDESAKGKKTNSSTREWSLTIPAGKTAQLTYRVRYN